MGNVRRWYKTETREAVEHLEKYSLQNAVKYEYFYDKWVPVSEVLDMMPLEGVLMPDEYLNKNRHVELKDTAFHYFLNVSDYRTVGEQEPYEFARSASEGYAAEHEAGGVYGTSKRRLVPTGGEKRED